MKKLILLILPICIFSFGPWGKDNDVRYIPKKEKEKKTSFLASAASKVILFHQTNFSPIDGPRSNFRPTSSKYMELAIKRYGFLLFPLEH